MIYRRAIGGLVVCSLVFGLLGMLQPSWAGDTDTPWVCRVVSIQGHVLAKRHGEADWRPVRLDDTLFVGDQIRVETNSRAGIVLSNDAIIRLDQNTTVMFTEIERPTNLILNLLKGAAHFFSTWPRSLEIVTPFVNGVVEGTEFFVRVDDVQTQIDLFEGRIRAVNEFGELQLSRGQGAVASKNSAPQSRILVHPRNSVQWSLYYPPILAAGPGLGTDAFRQASALYNQGQTVEALDAMETIAESDRDSRFYAYRAALLLHVGRVVQAHKDIQHALSLQAANSGALALKAVIAVVQNRKKDALQAAQQAVQLDLQSAAAQIALSYARQAEFNLQAALAAAQTAVMHNPENGTAWARLAELRLSTGELDMGVQEAQKAAVLNPHNAHAHTILGFAYLTQIKIKKAQGAFTQAIALDSAAPLPRLGLGLAIIRHGGLEKGRAEIEIAAGLDPGNALIRSYLGKAYFDEKRGPLDQRQFEIAKALDPNDPTPWFYDAIRKQTINRPVEALQNLKKSIELNDNRAVYRSRLLLDEDQASREVSLARIFDNLRFNQLAVNESTKSIDTDPSNYSAHRFLSDSYSRRPRHEAARVSELLQSQLLQPININPVQPVSAETDLNILIGASPSNVGFNEFTPLFERDGVQLTATGVAGNNDTLADQAVVSGIFKHFSYSLGQFHYETDGFRENNDLQHDLYNVFAQASVTNQLDLQVEYRHRETDEGDLRLNFDPEDFSKIFKRSIDQDLPRVGFRFAPGPHSDIIFSYIYGDREEETSDRGPPTSFGPTIQRTMQENDGYDLQSQYLYRAALFNVTAGISTYDIDGDRRTNINVGDLNRRLLLEAEEDLTGKWYGAYLYSDVSFPDNLLWTIGLSYASFEDGQDGIVDIDRLNPKFGLQWSIADDIRLRFAAMKTIKRSLIFDQSLEPTQVSGFNQFFDDFNGTRAKQYGIGLDVDLLKNLYGGIEFSRRDLKVPRIFRQFYFIDPPSPSAKVNSTVKFEDQREDLYRAYLYWTPNLDWAVTAQYQLERFRRQAAVSGSQVAAANLPNEVKTTMIPVSVRYFGSGGIFASSGVTYVRQKVDLSPMSTFNEKREDFFVIDASIGYRLPRRWGIISFDVKNLLDQDFLYQDVNIQTADPSEPVFVPERTFLARFTFNF